MTDSHPTSFAGVTPTPEWAFAQYQMIRPGLPAGLPRNRQPQTGRFGVISPASSAPDTLPIDWVPVRAGTRLETLDKLDGFIFLSSECWNTEIHQALALSLTRFARPVYVANPDLVAPRGGHLTLEPGYFAQLLLEQCGLRFDFFGKPYKAAFDAVLQRLERTDPGDILMVGDTLHTDILGGQAAGMKTMLITAHGALKGMDIARCIGKSGIVPDYVAPMI